MPISVDYGSLTFSNPLMFLSLLLIPLYFLWKTVYTRKGRQLVINFTGAEVLKDLRESRKLNISFIFLLIASILAGLALAGPVIKITTEEETANVMLVIDVSGSMKAVDVAPDRLTVAKNSAKGFIDNLPNSWKGGLVSFSEQPILLSAPTLNKEDLKVKIDSLTADRGTATGDAVGMAIDAGRAGSAERLKESYEQGDNLVNPSQTVIILVSDGAQTGGILTLEESTTRAAKLGIPIYSIALGTDSGEVDVIDETGELVRLPVPPDKQALANAAEATGGAYFEAVDLNDLQDVYKTVTGVLEPVQKDFQLNIILLVIIFSLIIFSGISALRTPTGKV